MKEDSRFEKSDVRLQACREPIPRFAGSKAALLFPNDGNQKLLDLIREAFHLCFRRAPRQQIVPFIQERVFPGRVPKILHPAFKGLWIQRCLLGDLLEVALCRPQYSPRGNHVRGGSQGQDVHELTTLRPEKFFEGSLLGVHTEFSPSATSGLYPIEALERFILP